MRVLEVKGHKILVDDKDWDLISRYSWFIVDSGLRQYAKNNTTGFMHSFLMLPCPEIGMEVDHRDRKGLNNQRANLRWATRSQNQMNVGPNCLSPTQYKGVRKCKKGFTAHCPDERGRVKSLQDG